MTQEEKQLLLTDLCARLPYKVKVVDDMGRVCTLTLGNVDLCSMFYGEDFDQGNTPSVCKPYLRPMSSMTEEERKVHNRFRLSKWSTYSGHMANSLDYLNSIHVDYRGLIPKGLALPAPEGMYKVEE